MMSDDIWDWITASAVAALLLVLASAAVAGFVVLAVEVHPITVLLLPVWGALAVYVKRGL
jgi:hypothetical protein